VTPAEALASVAAGAVLVAPRDATAYNYPSTSTGPRSHAGGRYHVIAARHGGASACSGAPLVLELATPAAGADPIMLCRRPACSRAWLAARKETPVPDPAPGRRPGP
jgi:hypothetical protein